MHILSLAAVVVGWMKGGHPERLGVAALLFCDLFATFYFPARIGNVHIGSAMDDLVLMLIFGWLVLRTDRWWPLVVTASFALVMVVHILSVVTDISWVAAASARVGLWILIWLALLAGVAERWLAGEAPISRMGRDRTRETI